jgi:RHS repeat-associated protein
VREVGADLERRYRWDDLGRLSEVERAGPNGDDSRPIKVAVDALGELAAVDDTPTLWDTAHPLQPLTWNGNGAVIGEGTPWALASAGAVQWLAPDWQGTIGDATRDPWGARPAAASVVGGAQLGYRGELEFDAETWLRHRVYQPASRCFAQPDPLAPEPATASAANHYHYAANNPIGRSDPLGLHPLTDKELQAARANVDHNILEKAGDFTVDHAGDISAVTGLAAYGLAFTPLAPISPFLGVVSAGLSGLSARQSFAKHDIVGGVIDLAGVGMTGLAATKGLIAARASVAMKTADKDAVAAINAARGAQRVGLSRLAETKYSEYDQLVARGGASSIARRTPAKQARRWGTASTSLTAVSLVRSHATDIGLKPIPPIVPARVPAFGMP